MNESVLIARAEKFLDKIKRQRIQVEELRDFESFITVYHYLKENLDELYELRDTMEIKGYKAPYRSLIRSSRSSITELKAEEMHDVSRQTQYFRMKAAAKKNILDRVKSSIASHKIAIGHLEEFAIITCSACKKKFKRHEIEFVESGTCNCGATDLILEKNDHGVYRVGTLKYLPLSGEYMVRMSDLSPMGREAFRSIVRVLKHEKRGIVKTVSLVVKVLEDGRWIRKRVNMDMDDEMNYEREIRKKYGRNARIEFLQFHRKKPAIINDKQVQTALSIAYVKFAKEIVDGILDNVMDKFLKNRNNVEIYDNALKKASDIAGSITSDIEDEEDIKNEKLNEILKENNLMDANDIINRQLERDLQTRNRIKRKLFVEVPRVFILWDIVRYYLTTSYDRRNKYSGPFPNLRPNLDTNQLKAFVDFDKQVVGILKEYTDEKIEYIEDMKEVIAKKFEIENKIKGLHVKSNPPAVGAAILNITGKLSIEVASDIFSVDPGNVKAEKEKIETFGKPTSKRAQKFLEMIKK